MKRLLTYALAVLFCSACVSPETRKTGTLPEIYPDYIGVTVPESIAPLNFEVLAADRLAVELDNGSSAITVRGKFADIPIRKWRNLTHGSDSIRVRVKAFVGGIWQEYDSFSIYVSEDDIDHTLVYRRIDPGYESYAEMGIYQRELSGFRETAVYRNNSLNAGCVNCHSFAQGDPEKMQLHFRGKNGGTLIGSGKDAVMHNMKNPLTLGTVYPYWHPSGNFIAYSVNDIKQHFHNVPGKVLEVYDLASDLIVYNVSKSEILVYPVLQDSTRFETFPAFSPDGRSLYFCCAARTEDYDNARYSLCRIDFDPESGKVGERVDTLWSDSSRSASFPRPSYDGRYLMFTVSDAGNFSIWHPEADLFLYDLQAGCVRPLDEINSPDTESYHSWSTNSSWVVFSSRRDDGRYTRLYISHRNADGSFGKAFMLPQRNPEDNTLLLQSYNIPEFCRGSVKVDARKVDSDFRESVSAVVVE